MAEWIISAMTWAVVIVLVIVIAAIALYGSDGRQG